MNKSRNNNTTTNDPCIKEDKINNPQFHQFSTSHGHNNNMSMENERSEAHSSEEKMKFEIQLHHLDLKRGGLAGLAALFQCIRWTPYSPKQEPAEFAKNYNIHNSMF